jgi:hypothetical protein
VASRLIEPTAVEFDESDSIDEPDDGRGRDVTLGDGLVVVALVRMIVDAYIDLVPILFTHSNHLLTLGIAWRCGQWSRRGRDGRGPFHL